MNYLLDTHTVIWFSENNPKLSKVASQYISDTNNNCFVSVASIWEMAIKLKLGKFNLEISLSDFVNVLTQRGFDFLPIKIEHTILVSDLELLHGDPFDRLLISQTIIEQLPIISKDGILDLYGVTRIW